MLDLPATRAFTKTCTHAGELIREFMSDEAIARLSCQVLQRYKFNIKLIPPAFFKNKKFVLFATIICSPYKHGLAYKRAPLFHSDPEVIKSAAISRIFGRGNIKEHLEKKLEDLNEISFLNDIKNSSSNIEVNPSFAENFLEKVSSSTPQLWQDKEFVLTATSKLPDITFPLLKNKNSPFLQDKDIFIMAAYHYPKVVLDYLRQQTNSNFREEIEIMLAAATTNAKELLAYLCEIQSHLHEDKEILLTAVRQNMRVTLEHLHDIKSPLCEDKEILLIAIRKNASVTFKHLRDIKSSLVNDRELLHAGVGQRHSYSGVYDTPDIDTAVLYHLREIDSPLKDDKELLIAEVRQNRLRFKRIENHLHKINSRWSRDEELLIALAETCAVEACSYLSQIKKPEEECINIFASAAYECPKNLFSRLRDQDSKLVENKEILLSAARKNPHDVLEHLARIGSNLWRDTIFMQKMRERSPPKASLPPRFVKSSSIDPKYWSSTEGKWIYAKIY